MMTAAELASNAVAPSITPVRERECLQSPTQPCITLDPYEYIQDDLPPKINPSEPAALEWVLFTAADVAPLRVQLPLYLQKSATTYEILTACLWRCRTVALGSALDEVVRLILRVNSRSKLNPPTPKGYYGNGFFLPVSATKAGKLVRSNLGYIVELVRGAKARATDEYIRSTLDFLASNGRIHYVVTNAFMVSDFMVSDVRQLIDFQNMDWARGKLMHIWPAELGEELIMPDLRGKL